MYSSHDLHQYLLLKLKNLKLNKGICCEVVDYCIFLSDIFLSHLITLICM